MGLLLPPPCLPAHQSGAHNTHTRRLCKCNLTGSAGPYIGLWQTKEGGGGSSAKSEYSAPPTRLLPAAAAAAALTLHCVLSSHVVGRGTS